jgi:hypothetical protein
MKLNRNATSIRRVSKDDDPYVNLSPQERISYIWDITAEVWSLNGKHNVKRRLQRNVTHLIRQRS